MALGMFCMLVIKLDDVWVQTKSEYRSVAMKTVVSGVSKLVISLHQHELPERHMDFPALSSGLKDLMIGVCVSHFKPVGL